MIPSTTLSATRITRGRFLRRATSRLSREDIHILALPKAQKDLLRFEYASATHNRVAPGAGDTPTLSEGRSAA